MKLKIINLLGLIILINCFMVHAQENDIIRRKIENRNTIPLSAFGVPVYCKQSVPVFYQNAFFETVWNPELAKKLVSTISNATLEGLNPEDYHYSKLVEVLKRNNLTEYEKAEFDILLTDAFMLYVSHLVSGKVNPVTVDAEWYVRKNDIEFNKIFNKGSVSNIDATIRSVLPKHETYNSLKFALQKYLALDSDEWLTLTAEKTIKLGDEHPAIPMIRERLYLLGDLKDASFETQNLYDEKLHNAVRIFQARHGIAVDGDIGPKTMRTLNVSIDQRIDQIRTNMERWRWLPQEFGNFYIIVNIANFDLGIYKNKKLEKQYKVIVGKPYRQTPVFHAGMQYLVLNPTWTVPPGILNNDIIPSVKKDPNYLTTKKIDVIDKQGNILNTSNIDWNNSVVKGYTYRQSPGPDNSLGSVKFMFPNGFHVYLHDTPAKELFEKGERAFSSGCIRVQEPLKLAEYLLNDSVNYNLAKIEDIVQTRKTQTIKLTEQPNVYLLYWTAWTDNEGRVQFREDIYERDKNLIQALAQSPIEVIY